MFQAVDWQARHRWVAVVFGFLVLLFAALAAGEMLLAERLEQAWNAKLLPGGVFAYVNLGVIVLVWAVCMVANGVMFFSDGERGVVVTVLISLACLLFLMATAGAYGRPLLGLFCGCGGLSS